MDLCSHPNRLGPQLRRLSIEVLDSFFVLRRRVAIPKELRKSCAMIPELSLLPFVTGCYWLILVIYSSVIKSESQGKTYINTASFLHLLFVGDSDSACLGIENQIEAPIAHMLNV